MLKLSIPALKALFYTILLAFFFRFTFLFTSVFPNGPQYPNVQLTLTFTQLHAVSYSVHSRVCALHSLSCIFICCVSFKLPRFVFLTFGLIAYFKSVKTAGFWWCLSSEGNDGPLKRYVHILFPRTGKCYLIWKQADILSYRSWDGELVLDYSSGLYLQGQMSL